MPTLNTDLNSTWPVRFENAILTEPGDLVTTIRYANRGQKETPTADAIGVSELKPGNQGFAELNPFERAKAKLLAFPVPDLALRSLPYLPKRKGPSTYGARAFSN